MAANSIELNLAAPGTILYTAEMALAGRRLNACALGLKRAERRAEFLADPDAYMRAAGLSDEERALVHDKDWTGLLRIGGHLQAMLFFAATMGETLWHIGSHNAGMAVGEMMQLCPRRVGGLPQAVARKAG